MSEADINRLVADRSLVRESFRDEGHRGDVEQGRGFICRRQRPGSLH
jgi:hypothetical protein